MPLDTVEIIAAALREGPIAAQAQALFAAMPPVTPQRPRKAVDFAPLAGAKPGTVVYKVLDEFSGKVQNLADIVDILELDPQGPFGQQIAALGLLLVDIND